MDRKGKVCTKYPRLSEGRGIVGSLKKIINIASLQDLIFEFCGPWASLQIHFVFRIELPKWSYSIFEDKWYYTRNSDTFIRIPVKVGGEIEGLEDEHDVMGEGMKALRCTAYDALTTCTHNQDRPSDFSVYLDTSNIMRRMSKKVPYVKNVLSKTLGRKSAVMDSKIEITKDHTHFIYCPLVLADFEIIWRISASDRYIHAGDMMLVSFSNEVLWKSSWTYSFWYWRITQSKHLNDSLLYCEEVYKVGGNLLPLEEILWSGGYGWKAVQYLNAKKDGREGKFITNNKEFFSNLYKSYLTRMGVTL